MLMDLWAEGVVVEFKNHLPCKRAMIRSVGRNGLVLADIRSGEIYRVDRAGLEERMSQGEAKILAQARDYGELAFTDISESEQLEVNRKYKYIKKIKERGVSKITERSASKIISEIAEEIGEAPPHWQSVRSWSKSFSAAGEKMRGLYPKHRYKGNRTPKINNKVVEIIEKEASHYFRSSQPSMATVVRNVEAKIISHNLDNPESALKTPSFLTVRNRVLKKSYQDKQRSRKGIRKLEAELLNADSGIVTTRILERVEIDHTPLDIHLLHDDHKTLLGRPILTVIIDHYSHMVIGFQLSFESPSFAAVCMACMNAFLPKEEFLERHGVEGEWPSHGIPDLLVTDNGNEFWGRNFVSVADELGPVFQYCQIRRASYKSLVERFFGMVNSLVLDDLPGVVRKQGRCGETYDARQEAKMTFSEFKKYFTTWLLQVYHNTPIGNSDSTPNERWRDSEGELPVPNENEMNLVPVLMATKTRELRNGRINMFCQEYESPILKDIYRRDGPVPVTIKYNQFDIGYILVLDRVNNVYIKVDCVNYAYASGLSEYEDKKIRAEANRSRTSKLESADLQMAKLNLANKREELHARNRRRKTQVTTAEAARLEQVGVEKIRLVVNNSARIVSAVHQLENEDLDMSGWSVD